MSHWLLRHCEPEVPSGLCLGQLDVLLTPFGLRDAQHLHSFFSKNRPNRIVSSDLRRARDSAQQVATALGMQVEIDERWRELDMGDFTGRFWNDIHEQQPEALARWGEQFEHSGPPNGESFMALSARVIAAFADCTGSNKNVLIVTHAGPIRALLAHTQQLSAADAMAIPVNYGEFVEIDALSPTLR